MSSWEAALLCEVWRCTAPWCISAGPALATMKKMASGHCLSVRAASGYLAEQEGLCPPCTACLHLPEHFKGLREKSLAQIAEFSEKERMSTASVQLQSCPAGAGRELGDETACAEPHPARRTLVLPYCKPFLKT